MIWTTAPDGAEWLAMDKDGKWHWFSFSPYIDGERWLYRGGGLYQEAKISEKSPDWKSSLEPRQQVVKEVIEEATK